MYLGRKNSRVGQRNAAMLHPGVGGEAAVGMHHADVDVRLQAQVPEHVAEHERADQTIRGHWVPAGRRVDEAGNRLGRALIRSIRPRVASGQRNVVYPPETKYPHAGGNRGQEQVRPGEVRGARTMTAHAAQARPGGT